MSSSLPIPYKPHESTFAHVFNSFYFLQLCTHCLEWPIRKKVIVKQGQKQQKQCMQIVHIDVNFDVNVISLLLKGLVLKIERYVQRLSQGYNA